MKAWVFLCNDSPLEHWMEGYMERFDAWEEGGVTGLVVGRLIFPWSVDDFPAGRPPRVKLFRPW